MAAVGEGQHGAVAAGLDVGGDDARDGGGGCCGIAAGGPEEDAGSYDQYGGRYCNGGAPGDRATHRYDGDGGGDVVIGPEAFTLQAGFELVPDADVGGFVTRSGVGISPIGTAAELFEKLGTSFATSDPFAEEGFLFRRQRLTLCVFDGDRVDIELSWLLHWFDWH